MSVEITWYIEGYILCLYEAGVLHISELQTTTAQLRAFLNNFPPGGYPVHLLIDHTDLEHRPPHIESIKNTLPIFTHQALGWTVIVSPDLPASHFLAETLRRLANAKVEVVATFEEAEDFLIQQDDRLG